MFEKEDHAKAALSINGKEIDGHIMTVSLADPNLKNKKEEKKIDQIANTVSS